jgi:hypothetical protein
VFVRTLPAICAVVLFLTGQSPATVPAPSPTLSPTQILSRALEKLRSDPVPDYAVWTNFWQINRGEAESWSTWRLAERFAERNSDGVQNVVESVPTRGSQLPDANVSSVFEGPFAWTMRPAAAVQAVPAPMQPDVSGLKTIASVTAYAPPAYAVDLIGIETVHGHNAYHLRLSPLSEPERHNLRDLWIDVETFDLWEAHLVGKYPALVPYGTPPLVQSDITAFFEPVLTYRIVYRLVWHYTFDGSYFAFRTSIVEIAFPSVLPDWLFDSAAYARHEKAKEPDVLYQILHAVPTPAPSRNRSRSSR